MDLKGNPYAALKQEEEQLWRRSGAVRMATVFGVYAASGRFIKDPKVFALSDTSRALAGEQIEIRSERPVLCLRACGHDDAVFGRCWPSRPDGLPAGGCGAAVRVAG